MSGFGINLGFGGRWKMQFGFFSGRNEGRKGIRDNTRMGNFQKKLSFILD